MSALSAVGVKAAIALRVAVSQSARCPWPLIARRFYLGGADAKIAYLAPLSLGLQVAGLRMSNIQARWALAVVTGRASWAHTLRVPSDLRRLLCADLGWPCLWTTIKAAALALFLKCKGDASCFAHARLANDGSLALGGWMHAAQRALQSLRLPPWSPRPGATATATKRSLRNYRRERILPRLLAVDGVAPPNPSLPWGWLAAEGGRAFETSAFEFWWQLRILGKPYASLKVCIWCEGSPRISRVHLQHQCAKFAQCCWCTGVLPEEAFMYPPDPAWFIAVIQACADFGAASF